MAETRQSPPDTRKVLTTATRGTQRGRAAAKIKITIKLTAKKVPLARISYCALAVFEEGSGVVFQDKALPMAA